MFVGFIMGVVKETGVAFYGVMYPDRAVKDFEEMIKYGCNAVLLGCSEFDVWFWYPSIVKLIEEAKKLGLRVYLDPWGWGKVFGGEPTSVFLQEHVNQRQISAKSGKSLPSACFNTEEFRSYVLKRVEKLAKETDLDFFFWDEPHYATFWRTEDGSIRMLGEGEWACRCETCKELFKDEYGYEMPTEMTDDVIRFRQGKIVEFLGQLSEVVKKADPKKGVCICLLPMANPLIGIVDWEEVAALKHVDMISTDPYWIIFQKLGLVPGGYEEGIKWFKKTLDAVMDLAKKYKKKTQVWVQAFNIPEGREKEIVKGIEIAKEKGVYSVFAWPYRAGGGSILASERASMLWEMIGEAYKKARKIH